MPARMLLFSSFCPLINYAKLTQLCNVWLSKFSNQNHATSFMTKSVGTNRFSYFLFLLLCTRDWILKFEDLGKSKKRAAQKESSCNNVCRVCQENPKVTYDKCVARACGNIFKPLVRKEIFGVVLSQSLKSFGITVIGFYIDWPACSCFNRVCDSSTTQAKKLQTAAE